MDQKSGIVEHDRRPSVSFLDVLITLLEGKWIIIAVVGLFSVTGIIVSLVARQEFLAQVTVLKQTPQMGGGLMSLLSSGDVPLGNMLQKMSLLSGSNNDQFLSILESNRLADLAIERFDLVHRYGFLKKGKKPHKFFREDVVRALRRNLRISENDYGNIDVGAIDTNPSFAADLANFIVSQLDTISYELSRENARYSREFFSTRLDLIKNDLDSATAKFSRFQIDNNYIDLDEQVKSSIEALAGVEAQGMAVNLEIEQLRSQFGENNQRIPELRRQQSVIDQELQKYMGKGTGNLIVSLKDAPKKAVEYGYLLRDVKVQESLYRYVIQLFEQAKFTEANNTPVVQVLEWATPPQKKLRPKRAVLCILFFFMGFAGSCLFVLGRAWIRREQSAQSPTYRQLRRMLDLAIRLK